MKIYSKITNRNVIGLRFRIIGILILLHLPAIFLLNFTRIPFPWKEEMGIISIITLVVLIVVYLQARYFEFDSSGEVISMKSFHPFFRSFERRSEFPKQKLKNYEIQKNLTNTNLKIYLKTNDDKSTVVKFPIKGLNSKQLKELEKALEITKSKYENEPLYSIPDLV